MSARRKREAPPPGQSVDVDCVAVPKEGTLVVRWLDQLSGMLSHWGKERGIACPGEQWCPAAIHRGKTNWKGYAPAEYWRPSPYEDWCPAVVEVTERLYELLSARELRGEVWRLWRQVGRARCKEVSGELIDTVDPGQLRLPFAVEPTLYRVYRTTHILLGVAPLLPPRLNLEPSKGPPPTVEPNSAAATSARQEGLREAIRRGLLEGNLPDTYRRFNPKTVAELERELAAAEGKDTAPAPAAPPRPSDPPGPKPSTNGRPR